MLTRRAAFLSGTITDTLAAILEREPDWNVLPKTTPVSIRRLLTRCLQKDARHRLRDIADARFAIEDSAADGSQAAATTTKATRGITLASLVTALLVVSLGAGWWTGRRTATKPLAFDPSLSDVTLTQLTTDPGYEGEPTFAPDGETVAYVSDRTGNFEIFLRQASGGRDINLTNDEGDDLQPSFSPMAGKSPLSHRAPVRRACNLWGRLSAARGWSLDHTGARRQRAAGCRTRQFPLVVTRWQSDHLYSGSVVREENLQSSGDWRYARGNSCQAPAHTTLVVPELLTRRPMDRLRGRARRRLCCPCRGRRRTRSRPRAPSLMERERRRHPVRERGARPELLAVEGARFRR